MCTIRLERLCYKRAWWFRAFRETFAMGIRLFAFAYRIRASDFAVATPACRGCIRFRKNALKQRSGSFRALDRVLNPVFNRVRDSLLTPAELANARKHAARLGERW
jgi:hypothetical protein